MAFKLKRLTIEHIKNVDYGSIKLHDSNGFINVLGIYGQNGSGKTTIVDAMEVLQHLINGDSIPDYSWGIFNAGDLKDNLPSISMEVEEENNLSLRYEVKFITKESTIEQPVYVAHESISYKYCKPYDRYKTLFEFDVLNLIKDPSLNSGILKARSKILSDDAIEFLTSSSMREHSSYLFSKDFKKRINRIEGSTIEKEILNIFNKFNKHIRIYTQQSANLTGMGTMPININYQDGEHGFQGTLPAILNKGGFSVPPEIIPIYEETIKYMNEIIPTIIQNLTLEMKVSEIHIVQNEVPYHTVNFFANRNGKVFSLIHESEGIKKIISMIGVLIEVYNNENTIAVIDELDSGIFEYLLGE